MSTATMVEPTGVPPRMEIKIPSKAQNTERIAEQIVTALKFLKTRMAERAGKITSAEISSEPTRFIARTIITAMIMAINKLVKQNRHTVSPPSRSAKLWLILLFRYSFFVPKNTDPPICRIWLAYFTAAAIS